MGVVNTPVHTPEQIREFFNYDPLTGELSRRKGYGRAYAGAIITGDSVGLFGVFYPTSRVCWCHYYGEWPPSDLLVDHRDRRHGINAIDNLRTATETQNQQNRSGCGTYPKGVTWRNRISKPYQAKIRVNGERLHLGSFATVEEAAEAYREACIKYHGEFACYD